MQVFVSICITHSVKCIGAYNSNDTQELSDMILSNNTLLYSCGALSSVFQAFKSACSQHDTQK